MVRNFGTESRRFVRQISEERNSPNGKLGEVKATKHRIDLEAGTRPIRQAPYRAGQNARELIKSEIDRMTAQGVIEPAMSEWASPVDIVPKTDGNPRFFVDYRKLNAKTIRDSYPIPRMDDCIDSLGGAKVFSTLDCNSGYWQIPIAEDKTAFVSHMGSHRFRRMPFGLTNAPTTFQRASDILLSGMKLQFCLVYLDDVIIYSDSEREHIGHGTKFYVFTAGLDCPSNSGKVTSSRSQ